MEKLERRQNIIAMEQRIKVEGERSLAEYAKV